MKISRKKVRNATTKANMATMKSSAIAPDKLKRRKSAVNKVAITRHTNNPETVHKVMAELIKRARRESVESWASRSSLLSPAAVRRRSSSVRARSIIRLKRWVNTVSVIPTPESRKTGATAS